MALSSEWIRCFQSLRRLQPPPFNWETPPRTLCLWIKCLYLIFSIDLYNFLSLVSYHYSFSCHVVLVATFKRLNVELQISKLNKNRFDRKVFTPSTKFRWSQTTLTLELLQRSYKSYQPSQPWLRLLFVKNHLTFSCVPTLKNPQRVPIKDLKPFSLDLKAKKHLTLASKFLTKPPKHKTIDSMAKLA